MLTSQSQPMPVSRRLMLRRPLPERPGAMGKPGPLSVISVVKTWPVTSRSVMAASRGHRRRQGICHRACLVQVEASTPPVLFRACQFGTGFAFSLYPSMKTTAPLPAVPVTCSGTACACDPDVTFAKPGDRTDGSAALGPSRPALSLRVPPR